MGFFGRKIKKYRQRLRAFVLVEILAVLAVIGGIGVFTAVYAPVQLEKARDAKRKTDVHLIGNAIEEYYQDEGCYPVSIPLCREDFTSGDMVILSDIPCDPKNGYSYVYVSEVSSCPKWFQLYGNLEYTRDRIIDKIGCRNGCGPDCQFNYGAASSNQTLNPFCEEEAVASAPDETSTPTPTPSAEPSARPQQYVCGPGGICEVYANPERSGCPDIYLDDATCQRECSDRRYWCHDERGKFR